MFRNYLVTALRNIARHKLYSSINIAGLACGLTCVMFILLFIRDETSYDKWVPDSAQLYRLELTGHVPGRPPVDLAMVPFPLPAAMREQIPEVVAATRLSRQEITLTVGDRHFLEKVDVVDPDFFQVIHLPLLVGDPVKVLSQPESVVLSQETARKLFGDADPIGRTITVGKPGCANTDPACERATIALQVTGVMRNLPSNSQLLAEVLMPNTSSADRDSQQLKHDWLSANHYAYAVLAPGARPSAVIAKLAPILDNATGAALRNLKLNVTGSQLFEVHLTPFTAVHLSSARYTNNMTPAGSWITVYGTAAIGLLILLVACFNFTNLATTRAMLRAREIALRKCVGANRRQLIEQFLGEALVMALCSLVLALMAVEVLLPAFDRFLQRPITFHYLQDWRLIILVLAITVGAGLISGAYPALVLSGFRPALVLRTNSSGQSGSARLRTILVVLQFAVSIGLGIAATIVFMQISFARHIDLGFRHDNIVVMNVGSAATSRETLQHTLQGRPGVLGTALSSAVPFMNDSALGLVQLPGQPDTITVNKLMISPEFPTLYDIPLVVGRLLSATRGEDTLSDAISPNNEGHNILINAAAASRFGYTPQQALGKSIMYNRSHVTIVGVLGDVKFHGAHEAAKPTVYFYDINSIFMLSIRVRAQDVPATLEAIDATWHSVSPSSAPQRYFLSDSFGALYSNDQRQGMMFQIFVGIAIFIACLGLFGLAAFIAGRRTKEIGIRKVFGARTRDVVGLLLWQFSIPVLIANVIAWPLAWYYLHGWLQGFAYRISLNPLYFLGAGLAALLIAWATIFAHAQRVARANPINALRYE
jgi:putative ABC transport system permease protein